MKKIIPVPLGNRVIVNRIKAKEIKKDSLIVMPDSVEESPTDFGKIVAMPDIDFVKEYCENIDYGLAKTLKVGDTVMVSKYVGTSFYDNQGIDNGVFVKISDILAKVPEEVENA